jgi:hypothetical protein
MSKLLAIIITAVIIIIGIVFIGLDILDIAEDFTLDFPMAIVNTAMICFIAAIIVYLASRVYLSQGSVEMLGLACGALAFGIGFALYSWLTDAGLGTCVAAHDSGISLAAIALSGGAGLKISKWVDKPGTARRRIILCVSCSAIIMIIGIVTWLAYRGQIDLLGGWGNVGYRDIIRGGSVILMLVSGGYYLRLYLRTRTNSYCWYSLGLILMGCGVFFISQGSLQSRTAWWGRLSEYIGFVYLLISAIAAERLRRTRKTGQGSIT